MDQDPEAQKLKESFAALKEEQGGAPSFEQVWSQAESQSRSGSRARVITFRRAVPALAVAAGLLLAVFFGSEKPAQGPVEEARQYAAVLDWEAPTDFLLESTESDSFETLYDTIPDFEYSLPDAFDLDELPVQKGARG